MTACLFPSDYNRAPSETRFLRTGLALLSIFLDVILPVFLVAAAAAVFHRFHDLPVAPLAQTTLYLLTPALVFTLLVEQRVSAGISLRIVAAMILATVFILVAAILVSRLLRHDQPMRSAFLLTTGFPNSGNMALPVIFLALGQPGMEVAVIAFITQAILGNSLAIFVAAKSESGAWDALRHVFRLPTVYAIGLALLVRGFGWELPAAIDQPIRLLSQAAIPVMLVVLGFQLRGGIQLDDMKSLSSAVLLRLVGGALLALLAALAVGLGGLGRQALIIICAMPVAVYTTILATRFNARPKFVSTVVIITTVLSVATLTGVVSLVKNQLG